MKTILESIKEKNEKIKNKLKERKLFNRIYVWVKDPVNDDVEIDKTLAIIAKKMPKHYFKNIDAIFIGQFPELSKRSLNASFDDGAIYVTNSVVDTEDLLKNIVHEVAHAVESQYPELIEENNELVHEFLTKRKQLKEILELNKYKTAKLNFYNTEYDPSFDAFLYQEVGYPALHTLTTNLFVSPYAATSFKEYFANGFEHFYLNDFYTVKTTSFILFSVLSAIDML